VGSVNAVPCRGAAPLRRCVGATLAGLLSVALLNVGTSGAAPGRAPTVSSLQQAVSALETRLAQEQQRTERLSEHFDRVQSTAVAAGQRAAKAEHALSILNRQVSTTSTSLATNAVNAYVEASGTTSSALTLSASVDDHVNARVYQATVAGDLAAEEQALQVERSLVAANATAARHARHQALVARHQLLSLVVANEVAQAETSLTLHSMRGSLANAVAAQALIIARQQAAAAAAARSRAAANAAAAAAAAAASVASSISPGAGAAATGAANAAAGAAGGVTSVSGTGVAAGQGVAAVAAAISQLGVPYRWGGEVPAKGFDCSGLTQWAWAQAGVAIPRVAADQWAALRHVPLTQLQPGDLLFYFNLDHDHTVDHVVMYLGAGPYGSQTLIQAAHTGTTISFGKVWTFGLIGAARP